MKQLILFLLLIIVISCRSSGNSEEIEPEPDCGCDSEVLLEFSEDNPLEGVIFYVTPFLDDDYFLNHFWVSFQYLANCSICTENYIVCNPDVLGEGFEFLKERDRTEEPIPIKFSGKAKRICQLPSGFFPESSYYRIEITSIELFN